MEMCMYSELQQTHAFKLANRNSKKRHEARKKAREKATLKYTIELAFDSDLLKTWREILEPITACD